MYRNFTMNRRAAIALVAAAIAAPAAAEQARYTLDRANSQVAFGYSLGGQDARGKMPVSKADILLDFARLSRSTVTAVLDPTRATAGMIFATEAMRSPSVLAVNRYPEITFRSTAVRAQNFKGEIDGTLTIRDVTRPVTLQAQIFRQRDTQAGDRNRLSIRLMGAISRRAFGATGYPDLVGDRVNLDILVRIDRTS